MLILLCIKMEWKMEAALLKYQVFINHRGPDTKNNLASLLYEALCRSGLRAFLDREELLTGNSVSPAINAAIVTSSVQIAIFSPTYAESPWCLEELCLMLQQPRHSTTIIPIFCNVEPSHLRRVDKGPYAEAFIKHKDRGRMEVDSWEEALREAADIKGHEFHMGEGDWGKFVYEIADIVQEKVISESLEVATHPVGLEKAGVNLFNEISRQMNSSAGTTIVGIAGLGGSGKTTLVAYLYNLIRSHFSRSSFLRDISKESKITHLQEKLLYNMRGYSQLHIGNAMEGKSLLRQRLKGLSRVLIVVDDIDHQEQIDSLVLPVKDVVGDDSLIVITSRDKDILDRCQVSFLYNMKFLDEKDAAKLFCLHAFCKSEAPTGFEDWARELVKSYGGHPLTLKILGEQFLGKPEWKWEFLFEKLKKNPFPYEIFKNPVIDVYESLEEQAKMLFLTFADVFGESDSRVQVWVRGGEECQLIHWIEILSQKCLVEYHHCRDDDLCRTLHAARYKCYEIAMHKFVRDMADKIRLSMYWFGNQREYRKHGALKLADPNGALNPFGGRVRLGRNFMLPQRYALPQKLPLPHSYRRLQRLSLRQLL